LKHAVHSLKTA